MQYLLVCLMFVSISAHPVFDAFSCVIRQVQVVNNGGLLVDRADYQYLVHQEFNVDKNTGEIIGAFVTGNIKKQATVIDHGSTSQAFKVIIKKYLIAANY